jgi:hypothetical protein
MEGMMPEPKSKAKRMLEASADDTHQERQVRVTIIDDKAYEYHLTPYESVLRGILDPDVPDTFIEVPVPPELKGSVKHTYLHTSRIAKFHQHDEFTVEEAPGNDEDTGKQKAVKGG